MNDYLATYSGGHLCPNSLLALIAASLDASHKNRDCVRLKRSAREYSVKRLGQSWWLHIALYKNIPLLLAQP